MMYKQNKAPEFFYSPQASFYVSLYPYALLLIITREFLAFLKPEDSL